MKNIVLLAIILIFSAQILAQTNFRPITYEDAITEATAEGKYVFIDFYTDWCAPCKMMTRDVFPQKKVGEYMNSKFVCIQLNAEKEGKDLAELFQVKAYPTFIVTDINKEVIMKKEGGASPDKFIAAIDREIDPEKSPERLKERYDGGERTPELIKAYVDWKMSDQGQDEAQEEVAVIISDYFNGMSDADRLSSENLFIYTNYVESPSDPIAQYMVKHRDDFAPEVKDVVMKCISDMYKQEIFNYLCAGIPYDEFEYQFVKKTINELGMNSSHCYDSSFELIECHSKGDLDTFLALCEEKYSDLDNDQKFYLMAGFSKLMDTDDKELRQRAAKFVRGKLPEMEVRLLFFIARVLSELEME